MPGDLQETAMCMRMTTGPLTSVLNNGTVVQGNGAMQVETPALVRCHQRKGVGQDRSCTPIRTTNSHTVTRNMCEHFARLVPSFVAFLADGCTCVRAMLNYSRGTLEQNTVASFR